MTINIATVEKCVGFERGINKSGLKKAIFLGWKYVDMYLLGYLYGNHSTVFYLWNANLGSKAKFTFYYKYFV